MLICAIFGPIRSSLFTTEDTEDQFLRSQYMLTGGNKGDQGLHLKKVASERNQTSIRAHL
jgi:hypothetical protein